MNIHSGKNLELYNEKYILNLTDPEVTMKN